MKPATTITKVCHILDAFRTRPSMGITELAQATSLLPSDVHRILGSLEPYGFIEQDSQTKKYHLGLELLKLGHAVLQRIKLRDVARPLLQRLSEEVQATTNMAIFDVHELEVIFVEQIDSPSEVQIKGRIGARAAAHCTAVGKVLLAHIEPDVVRRVLKKDGLPKQTQHTITTTFGLEKELKAVRELGYAVDREEAVLGACCIGAPIRDHTGAVVAAISASMMASHFYRWQEPQLVAIIRSTAAKFSAGLGYEEATTLRVRAAGSRGR